MTQGFPSGWTQDPNKPSEVRAVVGQITAKNGEVRNLIAVTNWSTGATIYYEKSSLPIIGNLGNETALFQINSSKSTPIPINSFAYSAYDPKIFNPYIRSVAQRTYEFNGKYGTDNEKQDLRNSVFYRSLANAATTTPQKPQVGGNPEKPGEGGNQQPGAGENSDQQNKPNAPDIPDSFTLSPEKEQLQNPNQLKLAPPNGIKYPINAISGDVIQFQAVKIIRSEFKADIKSLSQFSFPEPTYESVDGPVYLPTQSPINDQNSVGWGPDYMDPLSAFAFGLSYDLIKSSTDPNIDVGTTTRRALDKVGIAAKTHSPRISKSLAGAAAGVNNILARTDSVIFNPSLELLFDAPQLRPFTFTFKLSAREQGEADVIKRIIKYFKYHMAVRREADKIFLRAPHVFTIQYMTRSSDGRLTPHQSINQITGSGNKKACALTNCSVDYTPLGSYMTYNDPQRTMVSYTISLQFTEITPIYDTDYSETGHPIGF